MNVNDKWMLEQMQQMAASMATTMPQTGQNSEAPKTQKGESFKDMMDKARDQQAEAPKKEDAPAKQETVQDGKPAQKAEKAEQTEQPQPGKDDTVKVKLDMGTAALVAAGYAEVVKVFEDGSALIAVDLEKTGGAFSIMTGGLLTDGQELVPVTITNARGETITVTPKQIQEVFDSLGMEVPQKDDGDITLVGQIDLSKYQDAKVVTTDGKVTTLREAIAGTRSEGDEADDSMDAQVMTQSQPLFKDVKAAPVKVGENFQLDTQQPDMEANLADTIRYAVQQDLRQVEIRLSPENLGNLTVKLTQMADGSLQVVLHTANAKAANLLSQHLDGLNAALQGYSQNSEVRVEVQRNEDSQQAQQQQTNPDGHNRQQQQQQRQEQHSDSRDFAQRLRLGLFGSEEI